MADQKYVATLTKTGATRLISVDAGSLEDASQEIYRELSKPGRVEIREQWIRQGSHIIVNPPID